MSCEQEKLNYNFMNIYENSNNTFVKFPLNVKWYRILFSQSINKAYIKAIHRIVTDAPNNMFENH